MNVKNLRNKSQTKVFSFSLQRVFLFLMCITAYTVPAHAGYALGGSTSGPFVKLTSWMQGYIDFMDGPFAIAVIVAAIVLAGVIWTFAPKSGGLGFACRAVGAGIVILNVGTWMASFV